MYQEVKNEPPRANNALEDNSALKSRKLEILDKKLRKPTAMIIPAGLINTGNSCYVNSVLQAFANIPYFRRRVIQIDVEVNVLTSSNEKEVFASSFVHALSLTFLKIQELQREESKLITSSSCIMISTNDIYENVPWMTPVKRTITRYANFPLPNIAPSRVNHAAADNESKVMESLTFKPEGLLDELFKHPNETFIKGEQHDAHDLLHVLIQSISCLERLAKCPSNKKKPYSSKLFCTNSGSATKLSQYRAQASQNFVRETASNSYSDYSNSDKQPLKSKALHDFSSYSVTPESPTLNKNKILKKNTHRKNEIEISSNEYQKFAPFQSNSKIKWGSSSTIVDRSSHEEENARHDAGQTPYLRRSLRTGQNTINTPCAIAEIEKKIDKRRKTTGYGVQDERYRWKLDSKQCLPSKREKCPASKKADNGQKLEGKERNEHFKASRKGTKPKRNWFLPAVLQALTERKHLFGFPNNSFFDHWLPSTRANKNESNAKPEVCPTTTVMRSRAYNKSPSETTTRYASMTTSSKIKEASALFNGQAVLYTKCSVCHKAVERPEQLTELSLNVAKKNSFFSALKSLTDVDELGENSYKCDLCGITGNGIMWWNVSQVPPLVVIHIKAFGFSNGRAIKLETAFNIPMSTTFSPVCTPACPQAEDTYHLMAFIVHAGDKVNQGHYYTYARGNGSQTWFCFNDHKVTKVTEKGVSQVLSRKSSEKTPYLIFYLHHSFC